MLLDRYDHVPHSIRVYQDVKTQNNYHWVFASFKRNITGKEAEMSKVEVHGVIASPPTRAVLIVAKAIGVPHELKALDPTNKTPEFKKLNPQMQIPVMVDNGLVLPER